MKIKKGSIKLMIIFEKRIISKSIIWLKNMFKMRIIMRMIVKVERILGKCIKENVLKVLKEFNKVKIYVMLIEVRKNDENIRGSVKDDWKLFLKKDEIERLRNGLREYLNQITAEGKSIGYGKHERCEEGIVSKITIKKEETWKDIDKNDKIKCEEENSVDQGNQVIQKSNKGKGKMEMENENLTRDKGDDMKGIATNEASNIYIL